jgi:hypothetical protein
LVNVSWLIFTVPDCASAGRATREIANAKTVMRGGNESLLTHEPENLFFIAVFLRLLVETDFAGGDAEPTVIQVSRVLAASSKLYPGS